MDGEAFCQGTVIPGAELGLASNIVMEFLFSFILCRRFAG